MADGPFSRGVDVFLETLSRRKRHEHESLLEKQKLAREQAKEQRESAFKERELAATERGARAKEYAEFGAPFEEIEFGRKLAGGQLPKSSSIAGVGGTTEAYEPGRIEQAKKAYSSFQERLAGKAKKEAYISPVRAGTESSKQIQSLKALLGSFDKKANAGIDLTKEEESMRKNAIKKLGELGELEEDDLEVGEVKTEAPAKESSFLSKLSQAGGRVMSIGRLAGQKLSTFRGSLGGRLTKEERLKRLKLPPK